ncbi:ATP-grasp domain-containing protein [Acidicapsa ligni]|uniref:ATP-grasp domain-containing protein n=1 Tax=Acidicapsa ligni TaxID=542300 RepID=UPI0021DF62B5|nr:ATP-grasp domain-containing protein [Acidicapsa ligni]
MSAVCPPGHPLRFVHGVDPLYLYQGLDSVGSLKKAIVDAQPDLIVPCDDGVVWQLHELHARNPELRSLIERSLGSPNAFPAIRSRAATLETAVALGIRVPETQTITSDADLMQWCIDNPGVLKLDGTWGGSGVAIATTQAEAIAAFHKLSQPMGASVAWKRWLINHDPLALWSWRRREIPRVTIQEFIPGRPANTMFACWKGEVLGLVTVEVLTAQGKTGAATVVRLIENSEIENAARLLARHFSLSGFHGLDFILEQSTGAAYLIELNPRSTQLGHLRLPIQGDLVGMLAAKLKDQPRPPAEDFIQDETIAFFPQAITWNPKSEFLRQGYHDVPVGEPELHRELLRKSWPERQLLSRIYHSFRTVSHQEEVRF